MKKNKTFATVESMTGGLVSAKIVEVSGASGFFKGALITYQNETKLKFEIDLTDGVVSARCAKSMALQGLKIFNVDYCLSITGNAGPTSMDNKPIGLVFFALNDQIFEKQFYGSRFEIIEQAANFALSLINDVKSNSLN